MAVRHLKRYASWVQTVQHLKYKVEPCTGKLNGLNPRGNVTCVETHGAKDILTAVPHRNMREEINLYR
jgi:hypothetical protein